MKKNILLLFSVLSSIYSFAQELPKNIGLSAGKSFIVVHNGENLEGWYVALSGDQPLVKNWLSLTGRIGSNYISEDVPGINDFEEKSIGVNLDVEANAHFRVKKFIFSPSAGASFRYAHEKHIIFMSHSGREVHSYQFFDSQGLGFGYVLGLNLDYLITDKISIGARLAVNTYMNDHGGHHQDGYNSLAFVMKYRR